MYEQKTKFARNIRNDHQKIKELAKIKNNEFLHSTMIIQAAPDHRTRRRA